MKNTLSWSRLWPHVVAVIGFIFLSISYVSPVLQGKKLNQYDDVQAKAASREVMQYHEKTGEWSAWTNSMFGGMPAFLIGTDYPTSLPTKMGQAVNKLLPAPANYLLIGLVSAYVLFLVLGANLWLAALGAIAFAFASFNLVSIEAGHVSKMIAIYYAPGVLAGVLLAFRKNWLVGTAVTALFLSLELYANHVQITYYLGLSILLLVAFESVRLSKTGEGGKLKLILPGLALAALVALGSHTTRLWNAYDYTKETIRGKPELSVSNGAQTTPTQTGLDKEYAFSYSYGWGELFTLLVPNAYGGASNGSLDASSETYKTLTGRGVDAATSLNVVQALPLYWGAQPIVGGPIYAGAIVVFLSLLGFLISRKSLKYWALSMIVLYLIWALGSSFSAVNYLFFDYFPLFNKFRAITMVLALAQLLMVILAVMGLVQLAQKKISWPQLQKPFLIALGVTAGLCLLFAVMPTVFFDFRSPNDAQVLASFEQSTQDKGFAQQLLNSIVQDRIGMMKADAFRSLILILFAAGLVWLWMKEKAKPILVYMIFLLLMVVDMFGVDKRYLNNDDFVSKFAAEASLAPSAADTRILQDTDPNFKVLDLSTSPFQSAAASYFHKSLGGYHGAKMRRYQELFERQIAKANPNPGILNMLNAKYIISVDQQGNKVAQQNPDAYGHGWFVDSVKIVPNADAEMKALDSLKPNRVAVVDQRFAENLQGLKLQADSTAKISLITYKPNELVYESQSAVEGLAIFPEIYYNVRDEWQVDIDGQPAKMIRADYVLRALRVPAGKHTITFRFKPISIEIGSKIDLASSILLVLLLVGAVYAELKRKESEVGRD
ncbi:hypothetical protein CLV98_108133 [Dyadobacter jejuensis]|uniref:Membrane protein YfhO n=1 Tax=Dyadobacter jejuensis TaxID=1082580 RepID=A0A316AHP8_9BACT|nr:hypothetical protein [Dyadobacter jejuensis]PWJ57213.1 hypothetical protein CLV98_108133 [Dyadobacter jejuensis]